MKKILFIAAAALLVLSSCKKEDAEYNPNVKGEIEVEFDNVAGTSDLQLNTGTYTNASGETFSVTKLKYYVSNFKFTNVNGSVYTVPQNECYFLVDESNAASLMPMMEIPEGEYKSVSFVLGVDSLRNTKDVSERTGVLDVSGLAADMYWSWNSGYIFFKLDGVAAASPMAGDIFQLHLGGFGGYSAPTVNNLKNITIDLSARGNAKVKEGKETAVHLMTDVLKVLSGNTTISFTTTNMVHSPSAAVGFGNNCAAMFSHEHTHN